MSCGWRAIDWEVQLKRNGVPSLGCLLPRLPKDIVSDTVSDIRMLKNWNRKTLVKDRERGLLALLKVKRRWR